MKLRAAREAVGLTEKQVADKTQITERVYQAHEYDEREPGVQTAICIAAALKEKDLRKLFGAATPDNTKGPDCNQADNIAN